jgi:hypothetical protein
MTEAELEEVAAAIEKAREQAALAYEFCPGSYSYHAHNACMNASRIVAKVMERMKKGSV